MVSLLPITKMTSATRLAGPCTFREFTTRAKARLSFSGRRSGAATASPIPSTSWCQPPRNAPAISQIYAVQVLWRPYPADCPLAPSGVPYPGNQVPVNPSDPNVNALLSLIPGPSNVSFANPLIPGAGYVLSSHFPAHKLAPGTAADRPQHHRQGTCQFPLHPRFMGYRESGSFVDQCGQLPHRPDSLYRTRHQHAGPPVVDFHAHLAE